MPISIAEAQRKAGDSAFEGLGEEQGAPISLPITAQVMAQFGEEFLKVMGDYVNKLGVVSSGDLTSKANFVVSDDGSLLQIVLPDYFDFPNEGVRGVKSSRNAPNSPYKYKSFGMNEEGRAKIKELVMSGKAKIATVQRGRDKALGVGLEKKRLSVADAKTNQLIYWIKRQGIKATHYFDFAVRDVFKDFDITMAEAVGQDIVFTISKMKFNGNNNKR
jgi:hypothetical protein